MTANRSTPLHLALGEEASPFSMALLDRAIESQVEETDDLDWKQALPLREKREEFAKDVAAMANSGDLAARLLHALRAQR
ncbi:MAG TPA: hypothetical protein PLZ93_09040 [Nocardioides sp.]|uniref:hypothetical protein n=1 Tax=uncultured Nocardioides sp. TaxID=198441 RepID=UPI000EDD2F9E|nr:hypothetical protein [uncultured Nocardioides sp.]HCB06067.1 hypothetical protein [Nocardioides sp.]HRD60555.1 hypothetical protein [Nocardioides sp.]HRI95745.1 hypothetical protein [Nocardioides sp.]HRK45843.1 hypothetical protein [Nocardioides sp.]